MKSLSLHLLINVSNILPSVGLFVFVTPSISAVPRFFFLMQLLVRLAITKYSCLFGSLCRKLLQSKINERNPFRPAAILFGHPYQLIRFSFFEKTATRPYFCVFKYERAVKQKVWNEAENRERDWGERSLTPRFAEFFIDFEKKKTVLQSIFRKKTLLVCLNNA